MPGGDAAKLVTKLVSEGKKRVLLAGHEPDLSALVAGLVGRFGRSFDKAMIVGLHVGEKGGDARLRFVLDPRSLKLETDPAAGP
jgi:phosphohistidine phosphatase SixA